MPCDGIAHMSSRPEAQPLPALPVFQIVAALVSRHREVADLILPVSGGVHHAAEPPVALRLHVVVRYAGNAFREGSSLAYAQQIRGDVLYVQFRRGQSVPLRDIRSLERYAQHEIDAYVAEAGFPRVAYGFLCLFSAVQPSQGSEGLCLEALAAQREAVHPRVQKSPELRGIGGGGIALHGDFRSVVYVETLPKQRHYPGDLLRREQRGGASAEIDGVR